MVLDLDATGIRNLYLRGFELILTTIDKEEYKILKN